MNYGSFPLDQLADTETMRSEMGHRAFEERYARSVATARFVAVLAAMMHACTDAGPP